MLHLSVVIWCNYLHLVKNQLGESHAFNPKNQSRSTLLALLGPANEVDRVIKSCAEVRQLSGNFGKYF